MSLRDRLALTCMRWRMDDQGDWPIEKVEGALGYKSEPHSGDCTKNPWTCMRCEADAAFRQADEILTVIMDQREVEAGLL